jgi:hypothetical protein
LQSKRNGWDTVRLGDSIGVRIDIRNRVADPSHSEPN